MQQKVEILDPWHVRRIGCHPEGPGEAWEVGLCEPHELQQGQVQGPAHQSEQPLVSIQAGGWRDWERREEKDLGVLVDEKLDMSH